MLTIIHDQDWQAFYLNGEKVFIINLWDNYSLDDKHLSGLLLGLDIEHEISDYKLDPDWVMNLGTGDDWPQRIESVVFADV